MAGSLEELYLSHNGLTSMAGLRSLRRLRVLDLAGNRLTALEGVDAHPALEDLWVNNNRIASLDSVAPLATANPALRTLYIEQNPVAASLGADYRSAVLALLPALTQLDADEVA